jgi:hypothetical protein
VIVKKRVYSFSHVEELFLIVNTVIQFVEVANQVLLLEWELWLLVATILLTKFLVQAIPLLVIVLAVILILLDSVLLLL